MDTLRRGVIVFFAIAGAFILAMSWAKADDPAHHGNAGHEWYQNAEPTPAATAKFGINRCCAQAEVVRTKFRSDARRENWEYLDRATSTWRPIPDFIIRYEHPAPDNQPTLFVWNGNLTCFFVPDPEI